MLIPIQGWIKDFRRRVANPQAVGANIKFYKMSQIESGVPGDQQQRCHMSGEFQQMIYYICLWLNDVNKATHSGFGTKS